MNYGRQLEVLQGRAFGTRRSLLGSGRLAGQKASNTATVIVDYLLSFLGGRETLAAPPFGPGSSTDVLVRINVKLLLLGANIQAASVPHLAEQEAGVPYLH